MELRSLELPIKAFGAEPTAARVQLSALSPGDRLKRAGAVFGMGLAAAMIAIPIPLVHFILVPGALLVGIVLALSRLRQHEIFRTANGRCPFCGTEQSFTVMGSFRLPKKLHCQACQRQLVLESPTTLPQHSPTETPTRRP